MINILRDFTKYLKTFDISSPLISSNSTLNSKIEFEGSKNDLEFFINTEVYEDLTKEKSSDKYQYLLPSFELSKSFNIIPIGNINDYWMLWLIKF